MKVPQQLWVPLLMFYAIMILYVGVDLLRTKWRIVGNFVGALPQKPMQNLQLTLPLLLLPEEVALLLHKGGSHNYYYVRVGC